MDKLIIKQILDNVISDYNLSLLTKCPRPDYVSRPTDKDKEFIAKFFNDAQQPKASLGEEYIENYNTSKTMDDAEKEYYDTYKRIGQEKTFHEKLTDDEQKVAYYWTGQLYTEINYYAFNIRGDTEREKKYEKHHNADIYKKMTSDLESAIHKSEKIDENRHCFRYDSVGLGFDVKEGEVIDVKGFTAVSYDETIATTSRDYDDEMRQEMGEKPSAYVKDIYIPKGSEGMFMGSDEGEVLLPPGTRMYCFSIDKDNRRAKFVVLPQN